MSQKQSHTPGPWIAVQTNLVTTKRAWYSGDLGTLKHAFQATISLQEGEEQAKANARLIAAAPDLLEAAERFLAVVTREMPSEKLAALNGGDQMLKLTEAIAKAKGGAE